jgi:hypothetical protein
MWVTRLDVGEVTHVAGFSVTVDREDLDPLVTTLMAP